MPGSGRASVINLVVKDLFKKFELVSMVLGVWEKVHDFFHAIQILVQVSDRIYSLFILLTKP